MKQQNKFSIGNRITSFKYAFEGLKLLFKTEHNAWIHLIASILVVVLGFTFQLTINEWIFIVLSIGFVFFAEIINTSIEYLTDLVSPNYNKKAKKVKDLAAGGVLIATITAVIVGLIIFLPKIINDF